MLILILFLVGVILFAAELFVPGGILGLAGGICLLLASLVVGFQYGATLGLIALILSLLTMVAVFFLEVKFLSKTKLGRRFLLEEEITACSSSHLEEAKSLIGQTGAALTVLSPSGYVSIDERRYEAVSQSGFISVGTMISVVDATAFQLTVKRLEE